MRGLTIEGMMATQLDPARVWLARELPIVLQQMPDDRTLSVFVQSQVESLGDVAGKVDVICSASGEIKGLARATKEMGITHFLIGSDQCGAGLGKSLLASIECWLALRTELAKIQVASEFIPWFSRRGYEVALLVPETNSRFSVMIKRLPLPLGWSERTPGVGP